MYVWARVCVIRISAPQQWPIPCPEAGGGALKKVKEEGREEEGRVGKERGGGLPRIGAASLCALPTPILP